VELWLIRHGTTQWNATRRFQGHTDVPLSDTGRDQARRLAARLRSERFGAIYSSDLSRATETARIVAEPHALEVRHDPRLREFHFGEWEGLTWDEIVATRPHLRESELTAASLYAPDGGETFDDVRKRVASFLDDVSAEPLAHAAVVMHAGALHAAIAALGLSDEAAAAGGVVAAASLTRIAMDEGGPRLISFSDVRHLDSAG